MTVEKRLFTVFMMWKTGMLDSISQQIAHTDYLAIIVSVDGIEYVIETYATVYTITDGENTRVIDYCDHINEYATGI